MVGPPFRFETGRRLFILYACIAYPLTGDRA